MATDGYAELLRLKVLSAKASVKDTAKAGRSLWPKTTLSNCTKVSKRVHVEFLAEVFEVETLTSRVWTDRGKTHEASLNFQRNELLQSFPTFDGLNIDKNCLSFFAVFAQFCPPNQYSALKFTASTSVKIDFLIKKNSVSGPRNCLFFCFCEFEINQIGPPVLNLTFCLLQFDKAFDRHLSMDVVENQGRFPSCWYFCWEIFFGASK